MEHRLIISQVKGGAVAVCNHTSDDYPGASIFIQFLTLPKYVLGPCCLGLVHAVNDYGKDIGLGPPGPKANVPIYQTITVLFFEVMMPSLCNSLLVFWASV